MTQAQRLFQIFGSVRTLHACLIQANVRRDLSWLYRWDYPKVAGGCGGVVPTSAWPDIKKAAAVEGIVLPESIYDPSPLKITPPPPRAPTRKKRKEPAPQ